MLDLKHFHKEGFQILEKIISLDVLEAVRDFLIEEKNKTVEELFDKFGIENEKDLSQFIVSLAANPRQFALLERPWQLKLSGHFSLETRLSPRFLDIARLPAVQSLGASLFPNQSMRLHMPPTTRFVLPHNSFAGVPPHQDVSYNEHMKNFFVLWIPFNEITDQKGGVRIFKGTNKQEVIPVDKNQFWLSGINTQGIESVHCKMKPGDALLLNKWIVHASMPNVSDEVRISSDFRFFYGDSQKHYYDFEKNQVVNPEESQN